MDCLPTNSRQRRKILESRIRSKGFTIVGIPGNCDSLSLAMAFSSPTIVSELLDAGYDVERCVDVLGNHAFEFGAAMSRKDNLQCWLEKVKNWDINRQNGLLGGTALNIALSFGNGFQSTYDTVKFLLESGCSIQKSVMQGGGSALMALCQNESCDPEVLRMFLSHDQNIDARKIPRTLKFKIIRGVLRLILKYKLINSDILRFLCDHDGAPALFMAVARGDTECVKILLESGASVSIKNRNGEDVFHLCDVRGPFPRITEMLLNHRGKNNDDDDGSKRHSDSKTDENESNSSSNSVSL